MKYSAGPLSHEKMMRCIELYGRKVDPAGARHVWRKPAWPAVTLICGFAPRILSQFGNIVV